MKNLAEWITIGAGLALGKLLVCLAVIAIGIAVVALLIMLEEK
jgi:hypothetical protein